MTLYNCDCREVHDTECQSLAGVDPVPNPMLRKLKKPIAKSIYVIMVSYEINISMFYLLEVAVIFNNNSIINKNRINNN